LEQDIDIKLFDVREKFISQTKITKGQTIAYFNIKALLNGTYNVGIQNKVMSESVQTVVKK
jgi:hypothetical protein